MPHGNVKEREPYSFVPRMFGLIQPGLYTSIVNFLRLFKKKYTTFLFLKYGLIDQETSAMFVVIHLLSINIVLKAYTKLI